MMNYYVTNALYDYIIDNRLGNFEFTSGNLWQLVYGDNNCDPKLLVVVSGVQSTQVHAAISNEEANACKRINEIGVMARIPQIFIRFCIDVDMTCIYLYMGNASFKVCTLPDLATLFKSYGLPTTISRTSKYLNDRESSAYHRWQRDSLGASLKVIDIDLMKINTINNNIETIYELKRSYYSLERWVPFRDDYNNFILLGKLFKSTPIQLKIAYNVRSKLPWNDDISYFKIFGVHVDKRDLIEFESIVPLSTFIK